MTRQEHVAWMKQRALEYVDRGDLSAALSSAISDMNKHPDTIAHPASILGVSLMVNGYLGTPEKMREFIEGIN